MIDADWLITRAVMFVVAIALGWFLYDILATIPWPTRNRAQPGDPKEGWDSIVLPPNVARGIAAKRRKEWRKLDALYRVQRAPRSRVTPRLVAWPRV